MVFMDSVLTLDLKGLVSAALLGIMLFALGRSNGALFFLSMLFFLVASAAVTAVKYSRKKAMNVHEKDRGWRNVWANGAVPLFIAVLYYIVSANGGVAGYALVTAYLASVAAITADKFSSELGVLDKKTYMLMTLREAKTGVSGGVSLLGLGAGLGVAVLVSGVFSFAYSFSIAAFLVVAGAGFAGDVIDSLFGYFEENGIGNKFTTNVACGASAAIIALVAYGALFGGYLI